ncbi:lysosomal acid phosphatase isoform X2 [Anabrus simplex]
MSAECNLAGLYPLASSQEWHSDLHWQPIPVHTKPEIEDEVLAGKKPCRRYELELEKVMHSKSMQHINKINAELFRYLSEKSGADVKDVVTLEYLYDVLHCEDMHNLTLPDWTKGVYPDKMEPLAAFSFKIQAMNKQLQRLKSGPLLGEIISNMKKAAGGLLLPPFKLFMYSAHDTTVANLLMTLGVFDGHCPPYTALILIELRNKLEDYYVTVSYRNSSSHDPYLLRIPGCDVVCPLKKFIALTEPVIPKNWKEECQVRSMMEEFQLNSLAVLALSISVFLAFLLFISIILSVLYWKRQRSSSYYYHQVHTDGH